MRKKVWETLRKLNEEKMSEQIYKNPTDDEIDKVGRMDGRNMLKFVANHRKETFFIAPFDVAHYEMLRFTDVNNRGNDVFFGSASIEGNRLEMKKIPTALVEDYILDGDYDYLSQYGFDMREYKEKLRKFLEASA